ncbi:hypothetical protein GE118_00200 [Mycoplasma sp. NEAQ87857]|uniref:hypothetical protein n=1 Tax=Mycoplasma sp. NEAQ87857 TaxID=2683967 RepID=UPI001318F2AE|nr:hypothetical protein [Mycoplasma sp. NEAQ87857]QGZ97224.1 hypothetical protein GE118_00200 [Mycoplasma sp. NEAQ87857]
MYFFYIALIGLSSVINFFIFSKYRNAKTLIKAFSGFIGRNKDVSKIDKHYKDGLLVFKNYYYQTLIKKYALAGILFLISVFLIGIIIAILAFATNDFNPKIDLNNLLITPIESSTIDKQTTFLVLMVAFGEIIPIGGIVWSLKSDYKKIQATYNETKELEFNQIYVFDQKLEANYNQFLTLKLSKVKIKTKDILIPKNILSLKEFEKSISDIKDKQLLFYLITSTILNDDLTQIDEETKNKLLSAYNF